MIRDSLCSILFFIVHSSGNAQELHGQDGLTTYFVGNVNLIITVPHNGQKAPANIPGFYLNFCGNNPLSTLLLDRKKGCAQQNKNGVRKHNCKDQSPPCNTRIAGDAYTKSLAFQFYNRFYELTGYRPHMVVSELRRIKMDPNRDIDEGTFGDPTAIQVYNDFHGFVNQAAKSISGPGLLIDIHGQTHPEEWIELGYLIPKCLLANNTLDPLSSSINSLNARFQNIGFENLLRGANSFGKLLDDLSYNVIPSPTNPDPKCEGNYYSGGYITKTYGSKDNGIIDAIQIESPKSLRFNPSKRKKLGKDLGDVTVVFMETYYGLIRKPIRN